MKARTETKAEINVHWRNQETDGKFIFHLIRLALSLFNFRKLISRGRKYRNIKLKILFPLLCKMNQVRRQFLHSYSVYIFKGNCHIDDFHTGKIKNTLTEIFMLLLGEIYEIVQLVQISFSWNLISRIHYIL